MISYHCGCVNEEVLPSKVMRCVHKCVTHQKRYNDPASLDQRYYEGLGTINNGVLAEMPHVGELEEALGPLPTHRKVLEVGCGVSPYCEALLAKGCKYHAIEPSMWAAGYMRKTHDVVVMNGSLEWAHSHLRIQGTKYDVVLSAHSLEHMPDAPKALSLMANLLVKDGLLYLVVPDDTDPLNPDHLWFFNSDSLHRAVSAVGLIVKRLKIRQYTPKENFLYCLAEKP